MEMKNNKVQISMISPGLASRSKDSLVFLKFLVDGLQVVDLYLDLLGHPWLQNRYAFDRTRNMVQMHPIVVRFTMFEHKVEFWLSHSDTSNNSAEP